MTLSQVVIDAMIRGSVEVTKGRLVGITIAIIASENEILHIREPLRSEPQRRLEALVERYPVSELIVGYVNRSDEFFPFTALRRRLDWRSGPE